MKKEDLFLGLLEKYLLRFPFNGRLLYHLYLELSPEERVIDFHSFEMWFIENQKSESVVELFNKNSTIIEDLLTKKRNLINDERRKVKLMIPALESVYTPIGMFDN